ncbi:hypothetical protein Tco_1216156, partial [Tanacetum coccineum]
TVLWLETSGAKSVATSEWRGTQATVPTALRAKGATARHPRQVELARSPTRATAPTAVDYSYYIYFCSLEARSWSIPSEDPYEELPYSCFRSRHHVPPEPGCEIGESSAAAARQPGPTIETRLRDTERRMMTALELVNMRATTAVRAEIEVLRRERLAYEQESVQTRQDLARSEAHCRALEARVIVLETEARRHEWQRQAADDLAVHYIMRIQALELGKKKFSRIGTMEDTSRIQDFGLNVSHASVKF